MGIEFMKSTNFHRDESIDRIRRQRDPWDLVVIGGGATGVGVAVDAASRGLRTLLLEQSDFGKGTSSRSTKLVHGGVRYLQQGNIALVRDALRERSLLKQNAPHLVRDVPFLIPCRNWWQRFYYGIGLKMYDLLARGKGFGRSHQVSAADAIRIIPTLNRDQARGGVVYHDGQFDDARLLINMARTASDLGACLINYVRVAEFSFGVGGKVDGVGAVDEETGEKFNIPARCIVNAAGPFCDFVRQMEDSNCEPMIAASQGVHLVLPRRFFPADAALIVPKTSDGRVIFLIPWHNHVVVGTTDTPISTPTLEPTPQPSEVDFLLATLSDYLTDPPKSSDVLALFTGIRPLVRSSRAARTSSLSRDHVIRVSERGLITITGGKWTTVRKMAEDCVDRVISEASLTAKPCRTKQLAIHGASSDCDLMSDSRAYYGTDLSQIRELEVATPELSSLLNEKLELRRSDVVWAVRHEMARTVDDVLARRSRALFLNASAALAAAPEVARVMAKELDKGESWCSDQLREFTAIAQHFMPDPSLHT
jgi:glycerol-3-phosphate dehydrogenase